MHQQPVFAGCETYGGGNAEGLFACGLCLPSGSGLTIAQLERIIGVIAAAPQLVPGR